MRPLSPPLSWYSRKPVLILAARTPPPDHQHCHPETGGEAMENSLDRHVEDVLKRPSRVRRTMMGIWSFVKTRKSSASPPSPFDHLRLHIAMGVRDTNSFLSQY